MQGVKVDDMQLSLEVGSPLTFCTVKTNQQALEQESAFPIDIDAELRDLNQSIRLASGESLSLKELMDRIDAHIDAGIKIISHFKGTMHECADKRNLEFDINFIQSQKRKKSTQDLSKISDEVEDNIIEHLSNIGSSFESCKDIILNFKKCSQEILAKLKDYFKQIERFMVTAHFYILAIGQNTFNDMKNMVFLSAHSEKKEEAACSCVLF